MKKDRKLIPVFFMTVGFIFKDGQKGKRIVGGVEPNCPTSDLSWLSFNSEEIIVQTSEGDMFFKVIKIDVFPSISDSINIGLTLEADTKFDSVNIGDKVFYLKKVD